ncbi:MAG: hypothetical protein U1F37_09035 [Alphaproteobacteria bacterium]
MAGEHAEAAARLGHLRERGLDVSDLFGGLVIAQQPELARPIARLAGADAWSVRLLAETALPWPEDAARLGAPALLRAIALSENGPLAVRIAAAERAFLLGAMGRAELIALYGAMRFSGEALGQAGRQRPGADTPARRALLFQAASLAADAPARRDLGELVADRPGRAIRVAGGARHGAAGSRSRPGGHLGENALAISRVLFHAGDLERALEWYVRLQGSAFVDTESYMQLGAIARLADSSGRAGPAADAGAWAAYQRGQVHGARRIALLHALAEGLTAQREIAVTDKNASSGQSLGAGARSVDRPLADWREIRSAAAAGRQGEAILQMLTVLGHDGVARAEPLALGAAVGVLATLGRGAEARRFAVEAALANGF